MAVHALAYAPHTRVLCGGLAITLCARAVWSFASPVLKAGTYVAEVRLAIAGGGPGGGTEYYVQKRREKVTIQSAIRKHQNRFTLGCRLFF